jgi:hypothetical protein
MLKAEFFQPRNLALVLVVLAIVLFGHKFFLKMIGAGSGGGSPGAVSQTPSNPGNNAQ